MKVDDLIAKAEKLARADNDKDAMTVANGLVEQYPNEMRVWTLRAYLYRRSGNYAESVADLTRAVQINAMEQPELTVDTGLLKTVDLFFNRGADRFALGDDQLAVEDFTNGLDLCDKYRSDDYRETLHFWRAEALLRLGKKREALADLSRVADDFSFWTYKLRTKKELLADCGSP